MRITLERSNLLKSLNHVHRVVERRNTIPILSNVLLRCDGASLDMKATDLRGFCAGCYYADECRGGCHWTSHVLLGDRGDNPFCHHRALELMHQGVRERVVLAEPAPGKPFDHARYEIVREAFPEDERRKIEALNAEVEGLLEGSGL